LRCCTTSARASSASVQAHADRCCQLRPLLVCKIVIAKARETKGFVWIQNCSFCIDREFRSCTYTYRYLFI
jgi:hypothetical protein